MRTVFACVQAQIYAQLELFSDSNRVSIRHLMQIDLNTRSLYESFFVFAYYVLVNYRKIREKWGVIHIALTHRLGVTEVEEASVIIAVSSVHRKDSLEAVQYAIDTLKATVPIWKLVRMRMSSGISCHQSTGMCYCICYHAAL